MKRLARMMALTLGLLCLFTLGAGAAVARLLPPRLALFEMPRVAAGRLARPGAALAGATGSRSAGHGGTATAAGVAASLDGLMRSGDLGPRVGALVMDLSTGQVLYQLNPVTGLAPASTTKIATAIAALDTLGPGARFTTKVTMPGSARWRDGQSRGRWRGRRHGGRPRPEHCPGRRRGSHAGGRPLPGQ